MIPFLVFAFFLYFPYAWCILTKRPFEEFGLRWHLSPQGRKDLLLFSLGTLLPLTVVSLTLFSHRLPSWRALPVLPAILSGLAAAAAEETFFRGWLQTLLRRKFSASASICGSAAVFALAHIFANAPFSLLVFFPGLMMGLLRARHDTILPAILYHWIGNIWSIWFFPRF